MKILTYTELCELDSFRDRYLYLRKGALVGEETFGVKRWLNQVFYKSPEWRRTRREIFLRDNGCDLGVDGYDLTDGFYIHHINPITEEDIVNRSELLLNPEYLITTSFNTHNAIHFGDENLLFTGVTVRTPNDTCPWR